jgi:hypothetical protein
MSMQAPLVQTLRVQVDAAAVGVDFVAEFGEAPFDGTVTRVAYMPSGTITGANTNSRTYTVTNQGQAGAGTTNVATLAMVAGVNATGDDAKTIPLSGTAANLTVAAGDVLTFESTHVGTGIAEPGGTAIVEITRS